MVKDAEEQARGQGAPYDQVDAASSTTSAHPREDPRREPRRIPRPCSDPRASIKGREAVEKQDDEGAGRERAVGEGSPASPKAIMYGTAGGAGGPNGGPGGPVPPGADGARRGRRRARKGGRGRRHRARSSKRRAADRRPAGRCASVRRVGCGAPVTKSRRGVDDSRAASCAPEHDARPPPMSGPRLPLPDHQARGGGVGCLGSGALRP